MGRKTIDFDKRPQTLLDPGKLLQKARSLTPKRLGLNVFYVSSNNPDPKVSVYGYLVVETNGKLSCGCKSFAKSKICSHIVAVALILENKAADEKPYDGESC